MKKKRYLKLWAYYIYPDGDYKEGTLKIERASINCAKLNGVFLYNASYEEGFKEVISYKRLTKQEVLMRIQLNMFDNINLKGAWA